MRLARTFDVPPLPEGGFGDYLDLAAEYWQARGFRLERVGPDLHGRRGSVWGNLVSFDMSRLLATVRVHIERGHLVCVLDVDTRFQHVTRANVCYWELELEILERYVLHGKLDEATWRWFHKRERRATLLGILTLGMYRG
jgi:hypothetical protein